MVRSWGGDNFHTNDTPWLQVPAAPHVGATAAAEPLKLPTGLRRAWAAALEPARAVRRPAHGCRRQSRVPLFTGTARLIRLASLFHLSPTVIILVTRLASTLLHTRWSAARAAGASVLSLINTIGRADCSGYEIEPELPVCL